MRPVKLYIIVMLVVCALGSHAQTLHTPRQSDPSLIKGKGTFSFAANGKSYHSNPTQTKCWTSKNVSLAVLWASGESLSVSWQLQHVHGKGSYRITGDSMGKVNFTIGPNTYWIRKTRGENYLAVHITAVKDVYNVKLLSGTFEGILEDKNGNKIEIKNGVFVTEDI